MPDDEVLRVVVVRRGKVKPIEFRLRDGESGLSLFRRVAQPDSEAIIAAVRAAGKQGELGVVTIPGSVFRRLGLRLVPTLGGTPDPAVNALHVEARPSAWRRLVLRFRRVSVHEWFNKRITPELAAEAKLIE
ncbi:MAG: hypothetical protein HYS12_09340 [Planctomycetes bacterium]|nr:hypothetical protein [Planctomycetota bacterium]